MAGSICEVIPSVCSLRSQPPSPRGRLNSLSQNLTVLPAPSEREPLAWRHCFRLKRKACGRTRSPERADFPRPGEDVTAGDKKGNLSRSD